MVFMKEHQCLLPQSSANQWLVEVFMKEQGLSRAYLVIGSHGYTTWCPKHLLIGPLMTRAINLDNVKNNS